MSITSTFRSGRLKRAAVLAGVTALVAAGSVLGSGEAHAATPVVPASDLGNGLGALAVSPASGSTVNDTITWSSPACPSTANAAAQLVLVDPLNPTQSQATLGSSASVSSPFTITTGPGTLAGGLLNLSDNIGGDTAEVVVECFPGSVLGSGVFESDAFLSFSSDESTYQVVPSPVGVTLTASANPVNFGQVDTLTATASPSSATGTIQFEANGKNVGKPVTISGGTASIRVVFIGFKAQTVNLTAVYTPSAGSNFAATTPGSLALSVTLPSSSNVAATASGAQSVTLP